jgi:hypothetical protein
MKKFTASIFLLCAATFSVSAQKIAKDPEFAEWETTPVVHPVLPEYAHLPAYYILNSVNIDYRYEGKGMTQYYTAHKIVKILDEKGIASFNTISIPVFHNARIQTIKARTILRNGKVHEIAKEMIKTTTNEYGSYEVVIAMEGVEKNAEVELLIKEIKNSASFGTEMFQFQIPVQHTYFELSYPKEIVFEEKGYNGFPDAKDTLLRSNRRKIKIYKADIPALEKEPYSFYDLYRMRAEYRMSYFTDENEKTRLNTWNDLAKYMHEQAYHLTDKEKASANKFISTLGITNKGTELENIKKIEDGIKNSIVLYSDIDDEHADHLDSIISKKAATTSGYVKLFATCFTLAGVKHELGITTNRYEHAFDGKFENWNTMNDYVFYFPSLKKFLAPTSIYYRYPIVPDEMINNKGVFCGIPPVGNLTGVISQIRTITPLGPYESLKNINAAITFSKEMEPLADITYSYSGYAAMSLRTGIMLRSGDRKSETIRNQITLAEKPEYITKYAMNNESFDNYYTNKPLEITATVQAPQLIEKADKKYLFKLGDVIGKQTQLYKNTERKLPVDLDYPNSQNRTITVTLPKGYKVLNPEVISKQADYVDHDGRPVISFISKYTITKGKEGDKLTVTINEYYSQLHFSVTEYERYRNVINAASDFNKVTLVLAKK